MHKLYFVLLVIVQYGKLVAMQCARTNALSFCNMVDYEVASNGTSLAVLDQTAQLYYEGMLKVLGQFDCRQQYSLHTCEDCKVAYRDWVCAVQFRKCKVDECAGCTEKICLSLCEQVVRACPYILEFTCPVVETIDYSKNINECNHLGYEVHPDDPSLAYPGSFGN